MGVRGLLPRVRVFVQDDFWACVRDNKGGRVATILATVRSEGTQYNIRKQNTRWQGAALQVDKPPARV